MGRGGPATSPAGSERAADSPVGSERAADSPAAPLERPGNDPALFAFLFSARFGAWLAGEPSAPSRLAARFRRAYPAPDGEHHGSPYQRELAARLAIVRALATVAGPAAREGLLAALGAPHEHWIVKRSALHGLMTSGKGFRSEAEREAVLAGIDPRVIATASLSDAELFERAVHAR